MALEITMDGAYLNDSTIRISGGPTAVPNLNVPANRNGNQCHRAAVITLNIAGNCSAYDEQRRAVADRRITGHRRTGRERACRVVRHVEVAGDRLKRSVRCIAGCIRLSARSGCEQRAEYRHHYYGEPFRVHSFDVGGGDRLDTIAKYTLMHNCQGESAQNPHWARGSDDDLSAAAQRRLPFVRRKRG